MYCDGSLRSNRPEGLSRINRLEQNQISSVAVKDAERKVRTESFVVFAFYVFSSGSWRVIMTFRGGAMNRDIILHFSRQAWTYIHCDERFDTRGGLRLPSLLLSVL